MSTVVTGKRECAQGVEVLRFTLVTTGELMERHEEASQSPGEWASVLRGVEDGG